MRNHAAGSALCVVVVLAFSTFTLARKAQQADQATVEGGAGSDLSGLWILHRGRSALPDFAFTREEPPMTAWAEEKYKAARPAAGPRKTTPKNSNDPVYGCFPPGVPRIYLQGKPFEIIESKTEVILMFEYDRLVRHIFMNGRKHDPDLDPPLWMGDSIGRWDGDTLVIDTIGLNDKTWLDRVGHPHSDALHVIERMRRLNHETLENDITIDDPNAYTRTWSFQTTFELKPAELDWEGVCEDKKLPDRQ